MPLYKASLFGEEEDLDTDLPPPDSAIRKRNECLCSGRMQSYIGAGCATPLGSSAMVDNISKAPGHTGYPVLFFPYSSSCGGRAGDDGRCPWTPPSPPSSALTVCPPPVPLLSSVPQSSSSGHHQHHLAALSHLFQLHGAAVAAAAAAAAAAVNRNRSAGVDEQDDGRFGSPAIMPGPPRCTTRHFIADILGLDGVDGDDVMKHGGRRSRDDDEMAESVWAMNKNATCCGGAEFALDESSTSHHSDEC